MGIELDFKEQSIKRDLALIEAKRGILLMLVEQGLTLKSQTIDTLTLAINAINEEMRHVKNNRS